MSCSVENQCIPFSSYSTELLYDEINNSIFHVNECNNNENYTSMESKLSFSIIAEDNHCNSCKSYYSFIKCSECKEETCGNNKCCTLFPDYYGYVSVCKNCETKILKKLIPLKHEFKENNHRRQRFLDNLSN